jgi:hypothetical protein
MMELPIEVVLHVLKRGLTPEESTKLLVDYSDIRAKLLDRDRKIARIRKTAAEDVKKLESEILCGHEVTKYHGDPSGGSDSHEECLICGEIVQDKPYRRS